ncbi:hypothetical protein HU200_006162 [Digitaria exilis]|uniref:Uncharacterized protein n=1 Tax=Digitaria exilis TaxID=1010633 RepID=A0A835FS42_9POAL|nr:hypothetical protein HU200_006162 [Digitaria exilis]
MASGADAAAAGVAALGISGAGAGDEWAEACPPLRRNLRLLAPDEVELAKMLLNEGQMHLFEHWAEPGVDDDKKKGFFDQVCIHRGHVAALIIHKHNSKEGKNPYDGFTPSVPSGEVLTFGDDNFVSLEAAGVKEARNAAFVLVAGGLGERLGYKGIKVALPRETTTGKCFLQHYIESILSLQEASCKMVDGEFSLYLHKARSTFGFDSTYSFFFQEKVACLADNDARLALDPNDKYKFRLTRRVKGASGFSFSRIQMDCFSMFVHCPTAIPSALGVSATKGYNVNSLAVPRKAKEAIGGITKLTHVDGRTMVINVEYNQLDPLLRATGHPDGDANCETGYSPYPGNINQLILELGPYIEELKKTHGAISEFVNPKYTDSTKTAFKSSTRLECMMQDYPKTLPPSARVGFTVMDTWLAYAPVKNNPEDAAKVRLPVAYKIKAGISSMLTTGYSEKEEIRIRGFKFEKVEQLEVNYTEPGKHSLSA